MQSAQFQLHAEIEERHWWFVARRRILRAIVEQLVPPSSEATVIDVGCGTGANLASLAADYRCIGVDTSSEAIRLARKRFPAVRFIRG
ncbi:MAG TPA: class I SAM-dependent methyltransferase, partial [Planctomycetaceae bacterium]